MELAYPVLAVALCVGQTSCFYSTVAGYAVPVGSPAYVVPPPVVAPAPVVYPRPYPVCESAFAAYAPGYAVPYASTCCPAPVVIHPTFGFSYGWSAGYW